MLQRSPSHFLLVIIVSTGLVFTKCDIFFPEPFPANEVLDGPIDDLTPEQNALFSAGDEAFSQNFTTETGLGPIFVATSCFNCHIGDGKGHPFTSLTRFGQSDSTGNTFLGKGGPQLQNRAIPGHSPEQLPAGSPSAVFTPPAVTGLGFLAALSDGQILANADPGDSNGDGISGRPNYIDPPDYFVPDPTSQPKNGKYMGRFGKKAAAITLQHQTVNAYKQDIGITSDFDLDDPINYAVSNQSTDKIPDPEVSASTIANVVFYLRTLKTPLPRNEDDGQVIGGKQLFAQLDCSACHRESWTTPASDIASLSNKTFYPYTDLLLHDMGPGLDDGYTEGIAMTSEWRTPPLWGLGLSKDAQGGTYFLLHDGRARTIEEAILLHGGEAEASRDAFGQLSSEDREMLIKFLESL